MVKPSSIDAIDYEIDKLKSDIPRYCLTANKAAFKKGERDIHADRIVEWAEHRLANLEEAKADISALAERCERLEQLVRAIVRGRSHCFIPTDDLSRPTFNWDERANALMAEMEKTA